MNEELIKAAKSLGRVLGILATSQNYSEIDKIGNALNKDLLLRSLKNALREVNVLAKRAEEIENPRKEEDKRLKQAYKELTEKGDWKKVEESLNKIALAELSDMEVRQIGAITAAEALAFSLRFIGGE